MDILNSTGLAHFWLKIKNLVATKQDILASGTSIKTINGISLLGNGDISIELSRFELVTALPTTDIDPTKIYIVSNGQTSGDNVYTEYIYATSKWEVLDEFKSEIDLSEYAKSANVNTSLATKASLDVATASTNGLMSATDKKKLNGIASGAESNQNAFSNIVVGGDTIAADGKSDSVTLVASDNITLTPDVANHKIVIAKTDTSYSDVTEQAAGLMSAADKKKLDGISDGANANDAITTDEVSALCDEALDVCYVDSDGNVQPIYYADSDNTLQQVKIE